MSVEKLVGPGDRVVVAMSGGVDSSVCAALLARSGAEVVGVTLRLLPCEQGGDEAGCCGADGIAQARRVAAQLGVAHYVIDCEEIFAEQVLRPAWQAYLRGFTPNPCIACNHEVKFERLIDLADKLGARWIATGHYARLRRDEGTETPLLTRAAHLDKDQSYFLYALDAEQRRRLLLPLGELHKPAVRALAADFGLRTAARRDSQDACLRSATAPFAELLRRRFGGAARSGRVVDDRGQTLGHHQGTHLYTIGQRRGLGIATGQRAYVTALRPELDEVELSADPEQLRRTQMVVDDLRWQNDAAPQGVKTVQVQIRRRHRAASATLTIGSDQSALVRFVSPQRAVTPGQAAVFYLGDDVLGGGVICQVQATDGDAPPASMGSAGGTKKGPLQGP